MNKEQVIDLQEKIEKANRNIIKMQLEYDIAKTELELHKLRLEQYYFEISNKDLYVEQPTASEILESIRNKKKEYNGAN
jgi:hypothetical protein